MIGEIVFDFGDLNDTVSNRMVRFEYVDFRQKYEKASGLE
jgi:hypothetical protein